MRQTATREVSKRARRQFRLRALFLTVLATAVLLTRTHYSVERGREQLTVLKRFADKGRHC